MCEINIFSFFPMNGERQIYFDGGCCLNVYFILISITYNKMMIYIMVQYATLKKKDITN